MKKKKKRPDHTNKGSNDFLTGVVFKQILQISNIPYQTNFVMTHEIKIMTSTLEELKVGGRGGEGCGG